MACTAVLGALLLAQSALPAAAAEPAQVAREKVGKSVVAAQQLLQQNKPKAALAKLREADAVPDKTAYERYVVEETRAAADVALADYRSAVAALEAVLATGELAMPEALKRMHTIVQLDYRAKDYARVAADANRYYAEGGGDGEPRLLMAQAYYLQKDFAHAANAIRGVLQANAASGKPAGETLLTMLDDSEYQQKNEAGRIEALTMLVANYSKKEYWRELLLAVRRRRGFSPRLALDADRLMAATGAMQGAEEYMAAAQRALEAGLPGDAKAFLDEGYASGALGAGPQAWREQRLAEMARQQAAEDAKRLPRLATETDAGATGFTSVKLGEALASHGHYVEAIAAFRKGIAKGGLKHPEDARLDLGIAYLAAGDTAEAGKVLNGVAGEDGARELAQLWLIKGGAH